MATPWVDVRDFGAVSGEPAGEVVQLAVCALPVGGGVVYFPPGSWAVRNVLFPVPIRLHFADGCVVEIRGCVFTDVYGDGAVNTAGPLLLDPGDRVVPGYRPPPPPMSPVRLVAPSRAGRYIEL